MAHGIDRRKFLKSLAATLAIPFVPEIGEAIAGAKEPSRWIVERTNYDTWLCVAAEWRDGDKILRHAVRIEDYDVFRKGEKIAVEYSKQALREWYAETGRKKWRTA